MPRAVAKERLFDLVSYGRRGPGRRDRLSPGEIAQVARTVRRTPEVMVKVLSRGGQDLKAVGRHLDYLRLRDEGELGLDLEEHRRCSDLNARGGGSTKLVHKLLFSMPAGTPPDKVLGAVKSFAREEFGLMHRYAMVLHTDEPHPHVHMLLKAVSERGERLHIRKATLRAWRREFAGHLRELGVPANATERAVRGATRINKKDGVYRADLRGDSVHIRTRTEAVARELSAGTLRVEPGAAQLATTRRAVQFTWHKVSDALAHDGQRELASEVRRFVKQMPAPLMEKQQLAADLVARSRAPSTRQR
jgi:HAMP domain-containing protein